MSDYQHPANSGGYGAPPPAYGPPPARPPRARSTWWRSWWAVGIAALIVGIILGAASAGSSKKKSAAAPAPTVTATTIETDTVTQPAGTVTATPTIVKVIRTRTQTVTKTYTPAPLPAVSDGTYQAGSDIRPGRYHTSGGGDCYYEVTSGPSDDNIIDNGDSSGPQYFRVSDGQYVHLDGGCDWRPV